MVPIELYTIQRTGTRFVIQLVKDILRANFVRNKRAAFTRTHCRPKSESAWCEPAHDEARFIITVRNPYDCYLTWQRVQEDPTKRPEKFVGCWAHYIWRTSQFREAFYFALDTPDRRGMLSAFAEFIGAEDDEKLDWYAETWPKVGSNKAGKNIEESRPTNLDPYLQFAYEWYEFYTKNWGKRLTQPP